MTTQRTRFYRRYLTAILAVFLVLVLAAAYFFSWPYVIYGPGSAEPVHPRVHTGKNLDEKGSFLFTTVSAYSRPNAISLLYAWINPRMDIQTEKSATGGTTDYASYRNLLAWMRDSSEAQALLASYRAISRPLDVKQQGVIVVRFLEETKAIQSGLHEGDIITKVDDKPTTTAEQLSSTLTSRKPGDKVKLSGTRGGKPFSVTVPLIKMPGTGRAGIGFQHNTVLKVTPPDPVKFDFDDVGGPSAGLMMSLEIIAQLSGEDLTHGYRIAGTGTIEESGKVGQIGGIQYKLMAADKEKADYFLVPYDKEQGLLNWKDAEKTVKNLKLNVKLVPVSTLKEALDFVRKLSPKSQAS
ncbi:PDZ domain-containing protein [Cohnella pontilimi]|uniref:endopeptidase La n=1 Tax=Cohnella pontilimi TaxID=2564100 RepID=A0A4U0FC19_9BACL|nr:SepM family pheromone-processing serine protease [Cohnella pontilimi]TJY42396.1 PDZ domain-containing protein [Cohnella pontilimi]